jgi:AmpD protein
MRGRRQSVLLRGSTAYAPRCFRTPGARMQIRDHWLLAARRCPSPFADARPPGSEPELIVVHGISLPPGEFGGGVIEALFTGRLPDELCARFPDLRTLRVSAHLLIERSGGLVQFVGFDRRAWHAGTSLWRGRSGCNDFSIGIELEGTDTLPYTEAQYDALAAAIRAIRAAYPQVAADAIAGHADIAPGRKSDPGPAFDWPALHARLG